MASSPADVAVMWHAKASSAARRVRSVEGGVSDAALLPLGRLGLAVFAFDTAWLETVLASAPHVSTAAETRHRERVLGTTADVRSPLSTRHVDRGAERCL